MHQQESDLSLLKRLLPGKSTKRGMDVPEYIGDFGLIIVSILIFLYAGWDVFFPDR
ncbi:MAG: hypothetical protein LBP78_07955 [Acidaminococcales bacterium]|nr:hypothetical protein [Acidaminococcales bacterium]